MKVVLETKKLSKVFGMITASEDLSIRIYEGQLTCIVGPNGSGKTTFLNIVTGYVKPDQGRIHFCGRDITGISTRAVTAMGIARSFQMPQLCSDLTAEEHILLALSIRRGTGGNFWSPLTKKRRREETFHVLEQFKLEEVASRKVTELPEGERKLLDIAISFAGEPKLLIMDEPTSGVSAKEKCAIMDTLVSVLRNEVTGIFVEHDIDVVKKYAERLLVFHEGKVIADGSPNILDDDPAVKKIILG